MNLRKKYKIDPKKLLITKQAVNKTSFVYHDLKLNIAGKAYPSVKEFVRSADPNLTPTPIPQISVTSKATKPKQNAATDMAYLAIILAKTRQERKEEVQKFFLANDSTTFAINVPVTLSPEEAPELQAPFAGYIDIIQHRNNRIYVLAYIPEAEASCIRSHREGIRGIAEQYRRKDEQSPESKAPQLHLYRIALSKRANIPIQNIATASFNEAGYVEFG